MEVCSGAMRAQREPKGGSAGVANPTDRSTRGFARPKDPPSAKSSRSGRAVRDAAHRPLMQ
jgi:hypothetical protein